MKLVALLLPLVLLACPSSPPPPTRPLPSPVLAPDVEAWALCVEHIEKCRRPYGFWFDMITGRAITPDLECARKADTCSTHAEWVKADGDCCPKACIDLVLTTQDTRAMFVDPAAPKLPCFQTVLAKQTVP